MSSRPFSRPESDGAGRLRPVSNLHVLACIFNPTRSARIIENYFTFRRMLGNVSITVVELVFDDDDVLEPGALHVYGNRRDHCLWQKERLLNIGLQSIPSEVDAIAWLDTDVVLPSTWLSDATSLLSDNLVIQLFQRAHWLDANWTVERSFGSLISRRRDRRLFAHPGFAWAVRREVLADGFFDLDLSGNGDLWLASALSGITVHAPNITPQFVTRAWEKWAHPVRELVGGRFDAVSGEMIHLYHGEFLNRRYLDRGKWMLECGVLADHIRVDDNELYVVPGNPRFRDRMADYFKIRQD